MKNFIKDEIHDVLSGKSKVRFGATIQSITSYLSDGEGAGRTFEKEKHFKKQEAKALEFYISKNNLWIHDIDLTQYVSEGAEQKVYLSDTAHVLKLNDAIYYNLWRDYFYNLLVHNYFFPDTAYELLGFTKDHDILYAVVKQNYVSITSETNLKALKDFLKLNGFNNTRNNDYFNEELGIILEDLHDENVLTRNGIFYFIDTVFYLTEEFWEKKN